MDKNLYYCSYETCMLLKQKGFNELCDDFYCDAYLHKGEYVNPDHLEDYNESEITVEPGGMFCNLANFYPLFCSFKIITLTLSPTSPFSLSKRISSSCSCV